MRATIFAAMTLACASALGAQETTGDVRGWVRDAEGLPVAGASVIATGPNLQGSRAAQTAVDGAFRLLLLPPGVYAIHVQRVGFRTVDMDSVRVELGRTTATPDVRLRQAVVELAAEKVVAPRLSLDPVRTTVGTTLEASDLAALPGGRDFTSLMAIIPHVNASYYGDPANSAGSTGLENMLIIDGVNVTNPLRGGTGTALPFNFVRSVEVRAGGYDAQFGRALGAVVNAVTYTGTNEFEADIFGFFNNSALTLTPRSETSLRETRSIAGDAGIRVGGPVVHDRLWFSGAYNPRREQVTRELPGLGDHADWRRTNAAAGKLTWQADGATNVELSVFADPTMRNEVAMISWLPSDLRLLNADPFLHRIETGGSTVSLRASRMIGPGLVVEAGIATAGVRENTEAATPRGQTEMLTLDRSAGTLSGGSWGYGRYDERRVSALARVTLLHGRHSTEAGLDYDRARVTGGFGSTLLTKIRADSFELASQSVGGTVINRAPAVYVQDAWRLSNRVTLNIGLRWSTQALIAPTRETAQRFDGEWQPRVGFSMALDDRGTERIFGSFGRFYQQQPLNLSVGYYNDYIGTTGYYHADPRGAGARADAVSDYSTPGSLFAHSTAGAHSERFDEVTAGYERLVRAAMLTLRLMHRHLGTAFQQGIDFTNPPYFFLGSPGQGDLAFLPTPKRDYSALEASLAGDWRAFRYRASYVLSRTWGNFPGYFSSDVALGDPGVNYILQFGEQAANASGLLPNDRTHVAKLSGSVSLTPRLLAGAFVTWQSGTPLSELGTGAVSGCCSSPIFLAQRGTAGRTPALLDANARLSWSPTVARVHGATAILDLLHIGNPRTAVRIEQQHYTAIDANGAQILPNANYGKPIKFLPPMSARLGFDVRF